MLFFPQTMGGKTMYETTDILSFLNSFDTDEKCRSFLEEIRWPNGPVCPHCGHNKAWKTKTKTHRPGVYVCGNCDKQFTVTVGTIFEGTHLPLPKWFLAIYLI
ncbi:MAG: hypothetical protein GF403_02765, partial [Candidatus Coatesbacteria bacterium]|nr:hypothetical protein [Candidatus Coatesbacteria bacterium]